ncbi:MAG: prepilin-type N-terminal cleavage/methylation domain-containing protein [Planctomycetes bacterium]|nr:prepilin-type N-terminal cleavage/methylation domain-containing protein [Planctomycetota bacterium]
MKNRKGFTLVEMLVVISIIGIGAAMTFAIGSGFVKGNKVSQATRITQAALLEARSRAIATRLQTSMVIYHLDNLAVITDHRWVPLGQPIVLPEPCYFYVHSAQGYLAPGQAINKIAPAHYIMTVTFESTGAAIKNLPRAYWNGETRCGAIFLNIIDPTTVRFGQRGGKVQSVDGDTIDLTGWTGEFATKGYAVIGSELVSYNTLGYTDSRRAQLRGVQRGLYGSGDSSNLVGKPVFTSGFCGSIMIIAATGQVVTVLM